MTGRSMRIGGAGAGALAIFYIAVIGWASGITHLATQAAADWPYLAAIVAGFGLQLALLAELRHVSTPAVPVSPSPSTHTPQRPAATLPPTRPSESATPRGLLPPGRATGPAVTIAVAR